MSDAPPPPLPQPVGMRTLLGWGILGQLVYVASQFVTLLALTRFATLQDVGIFGLASAVVIPVFFFFDLGMRVNVAASAKSSYSFQEFRTLLLISLAIGFGVVLVIGFTTFSGSALTILLIIGATKCAESFSNFCYGIFQRFDDMRRVAGSLVLRSMGGTVAFVLLLMQGVAVELAFLAQFGVWTAVALGVDHPRARKLWRHHGAQEGQDWARIRHLARSAFPLALNGLLSALQGNMPRYAIVWLLSVMALGQFTVVAYAMQAISTVTMAAMQSLTARFSSFLTARNPAALMRALRKIISALAIFALCAVGGSVLVGDWLIETVFGRDYAGLGTLLAICVLGACLRAMVLALQMCLLAGRRYTRTLAIRAGAVVTMLLGCLLGGLLGGLNGIAWGMCVAFVVHIGALALAVRTLLQYGPAPERDIGP